jgi:hypothetical protein
LYRCGEVFVRLLKAIAGCKLTRQGTFVSVDGTHALKVGLALFTIFSPELGLWVWLFSQRYFAVKTPIDYSQYVWSVYYSNQPVTQE